MSVEIRLASAGECECGPKPIGYERKCHHWFECDWGIIENGEANPRIGLKHLMLITGDFMVRMLQFGPEAGTRGGIASCSRDGARLFVHLDTENGRTTWELFEAHFWDGGGPDDLMIGRWPD